MFCPMSSVGTSLLPAVTLMSRVMWLHTANWKSSWALLLVVFPLTNMAGSTIWVRPAFSFVISQEWNGPGLTLLVWPFGICRAGSAICSMRMRARTEPGGCTSGMAIFPEGWCRLHRQRQAVLAWMLQLVSITRAILLECSLAEPMVIRSLRSSIYLLICVSADMLMSKWHPPLLPVLMARLLSLIFFSKAITRLSTVTLSFR